jgi:DNA-binding transcriptional LysR family regulator
MESISFAELLDEPLLLRKVGSGTRQAFDFAYKQYAHLGKSPNILAHVDNNEMAMLCVHAGLGLSIVSSISIVDKVKAGFLRVLPLSDYTFEHAFYFVYSKNHALSPLVSRFKDFVLSRKDNLDPTAR